MKEWICQEEPLIRADGASVGVGFRQMTELVRCKDCRHCTFSDGEQLADCMIKQGWFPVKPDWYCADGERRTDDA